MGKSYCYDVIDRNTGEVVLKSSTARDIGDTLCIPSQNVHIYAERGIVAKKRWVIRKCEDEQVVDEFYTKFKMPAKEFDRQMDDIRQMFGKPRRFDE